MTKSKKDAGRAAQIREDADLRVYVVGGGYQYIRMFHEAGFRGATGVDDADIVCFTGGEDVHPSLYGEEVLPRTGSNLSRDEREMLIFADAAALQKPMVGICRGAQFLNVMNGGKLWQHVDNHATGRRHPVIDFRTGEKIDNMTSTHHQQMREGPNAEIIAVAELSTFKEAANDVLKRDEPSLDDLEVLWYPGTLSLCFQPHPEMYPGECREYFIDLVDEYLLPAS